VLKFVLDITENFMNTEQKSCQNNSLNFILSSWSKKIVLLRLINIVCLGVHFSVLEWDCPCNEFTFRIILLRSVSRLFGYIPYIAYWLLEDLSSQLLYKNKYCINYERLIKTFVCKQYSAYYNTRRYWIWNFWNEPVL